MEMAPNSGQASRIKAAKEAFEVKARVWLNWSVVSRSGIFHHVNKITAVWPFALVLFILSTKKWVVLVNYYVYQVSSQKSFVGAIAWHVEWTGSTKTISPPSLQGRLDASWSYKFGWKRTWAPLPTCLSVCLSVPLSFSFTISHAQDREISPRCRRLFISIASYNF